MNSPQRSDDQNAFCYNDFSNFVVLAKKPRNERKLGRQAESFFDALLEKRKLFQIFNCRRTARVSKHFIELFVNLSLKFWFLCYKPNCEAHADGCRVVAFKHRVVF
ncbi:hypothetical protein L596_013086 [Steinernema carpocapsae]|uniref:Uncharacterized protein n=1 Tax=Steinernema carpocapsae TaxID=34508 RepID=A0A4U5NZZ9_STECR|nr:hypothetical protein L596_013086 [Steinernema carpocapsae]